MRQRWLDGGGHVNARSSYAHGYTLLMVACEVGSVPLVEALLERRAAVEMRSRSHAALTALMIAAQGGQDQIIHLLLRPTCVADFRQGNAVADALKMAEEQQFEGMDEAATKRIVDTLSSHKEWLSAQPLPEQPSQPDPFVLLTRSENSEDDGSFFMPLDLALRHNAPASLVRCLIKHGEYPEGCLPITLAVSLGVSTDVLAIMCAADEKAIKRPVTDDDEDSLNALDHAALRRDPRALRVLLDADPTILVSDDAASCTPLHVLARGPTLEAKRLPRSDDGTERDAHAVHSHLADADAAEACELLLAAYPEAARRATLMRLENLGVWHMQQTKRTPLHLAAEYHAPPTLLLKLLDACPDAASMHDFEGTLLPCHSISGKHATDEQARPLEALLAAFPPSPEWSLRQLLRLGSSPGAEAATLARLAAHPNEARERDPVPAPSNAWEQRQYEYRRYPLHYAAESAAPRAVLAELIRLCPEAVRKQTFIGDYPLHLAVKAAASLYKGIYGEVLRRAQPSEALCAAAAGCVGLLLEVWPSGATACAGSDALGLPPDASSRAQRDACGWWPLHTALHFHAPEVVLEKLRDHTPVDAFGNPVRPNPGQRGATKANHADLRKIQRGTGVRSCQLRFLCEGARGTPQDMQWSAGDLWGRRWPDGRLRLTEVRAASLDPSKENVDSLEPERDDADTEGGSEEEEESD